MKMSDVAVQSVFIFLAVTKLKRHDVTHTHIHYIPVDDQFYVTLKF